MNTTRAIAIGAFVGVIVLLLAVIIFVEAANSSHTVKVWLMTKDVTAGQAFATDSVQQVDVKGQAGDFAYATDVPSSRIVFKHAMSKTDIVRQDDLVDATKVVEIPITPAATVDLTSTDLIDVYMLVQETGQPACVQLIGSQIPVAGGTGAALTIQVPRANEADWLTLTNASSNKLLVASSGGSVAGGAKDCLPDAITHLIAAAASGSSS